MSNLYLPSYGQGFVRCAAEAEYPNLWDGLVGLWAPFLGPTGLTLFDHSRRHNNGTLTNMDPASDWMVGEMGYVLDVGSSGATEHISVPGTPAFTDISICFWVRPDSTTADEYISDFGGDNEFACICGYQDGFYNLYGGSYPNFDDANSKIPMSGAGIWDFVVWTKQGTAMRGYVNGVLEKSFEHTHGDFSPSAGLKIGNSWGEGAGFNGQIASYELYSRELIGAEIQLKYVDSHASLRPRRRIIAKAPAAAVGNPWHYYQQSSMGAA